MKKSRIFGMLFLVAILLVIWGVTVGIRVENSGTKKSENTVETDDFSCYTYDGYYSRINGYQRETDGNWYLFVPAVQSISALEICYTGNVETVSTGALDEESHTITGAFSNSGDSVELTLDNGDTITVIALQSDLPGVQIDLNDITLGTLHENKDIKYSKNTLTLTDPNGVYDMPAVKNVVIKGRGNSTWTLSEKKAYQVQFPVETSILGMEKARKWLLLANAFDDSMIRSQLVYQMADKMDMDFSPDFAYVDLWIDGDYRGTYMIGEKVEIEDSRLNLTRPDAILMEHDEGFYEEEDYWFKSELLQKHFTVKDAGREEPGLILNAMRDFAVAVDELTEYLYTTPSECVTLAKLSEMIDVDSFAKYYLINEYALNTESFVSSFYWYKNGAEDVIHLGPAWDFDTCMGNNGLGTDASYGCDHVLFTYLLASPAFWEHTVALYEQYKDAFAAMTEEVKALRMQIEASAKMNYLRWDILGTVNPKAPTETQKDTFEEAITALESWLRGREEKFAVAETKVVECQVEKEISVLEVQLPNDKPYTMVLFAVFNGDESPANVLWYVGELTDGAWRCQVDLTDFESAGLYHINAYADGEPAPAANGYGYVEVPLESENDFHIEIAEDGKQLFIELTETEASSNISFGVWSSVNGQDDMGWYEATRSSKGSWTCTIDMTGYVDTGEYWIQAYEIDKSGQTMQNAAQNCKGTYRFEK